MKVHQALPFDKIARIGFGWYAPDPDEPETVPTLNLFLKRTWLGIPHRRMLAYWMKGKDKQLLFNLLNGVVSKVAPKIDIGPEK